MFKGFYNLTSGMLSQGRRLDVVANNMTNISTPGYKSDHYTDSTFDEALYVRIGNKNRLSDAEMGEIMASGRVGRLDAAVLAAANLADQLLKQQASTENLRSQLKDYLDDANKAKAELSECRRELFKLQQKK